MEQKCFVENESYLLEQGKNDKKKRKKRTWWGVSFHLIVEIVDCEPKVAVWIYSRRCEMLWKFSVGCIERRNLDT